MFLAFIAVVVLLGIFLIAMYNSLVQLRVRSESAWSDIDVQLKRRHDLVPNLVETVKGYATHEKSTFEDIAKFRSMAMQATGPVDKAAAENQLSGALNVYNIPSAQPSPGLTRDYSVGLAVTIPVFFPFNELSSIQAAARTRDAAGPTAPARRSGCRT